VGQIYSDDSDGKWVRFQPTLTRSGLILAAIAVVKSAWVVLNAWNHPLRLIEYRGFAPDRTGTATGWIAAAVVVIAFVGLAARLPSVRATMWQPSWLKLLGLAVAVAAGILEEVVFRKLLMDGLAADAYGTVSQIL
jgi:membrane protease YdiL (CAAX protease family)